MADCIIIPRTVEIYETPVDDSAKEITQPDGTQKVFSCQNFVLAQIEPEAEIELTQAAMLHLHFNDSALNCMRVLFIRWVDCRSCESASGVYEHNLGMKSSGAIIPPGKYTITIPQQSYIDLCGQEAREIPVEIVLEPLSEAFLLASRCGV